MTLAPGTRLGPYEIVAPLGAGGMGEVYRARDTRLGRDVAVKVLPQHLSANPEVRTRFEREAKTVSALNHPNICTLFDVGREGDTDYLVMELVEGETLAQRLQRGPLAPAEVLKLGAQIADGLDRAHRAGVIHRDLKPGNVMVTKNGAKLMDFGLARATGLAGPAGGASVLAMTQSPTMAAPLTAEGTIVGTFQYMAPEQLEAKESDARSDLWALGCVLYEMTTGKRAFEGASQASLIGAIMNTEPAPMTSLAPMSPPALERVVKQCLAKDPDERWQSAGDVRRELEWIATGSASVSGVAVAAAVPGAPAGSRRSRAPLAIGVWAVLATLAFAIATWRLTRAPEQSGAAVLELPTAPGAPLSSEPGDIAISPDGQRVAYIGVDSSGVGRLWVRALDSPNARMIPGTENAVRPFWSPNGRWIAYFTSGDGSSLEKVPAGEGAPVKLCDVGWARGGAWGSHGDILFSPTPTSALERISEEGGPITPVTVLDSTRHETSHRNPCFLPDGEHFLYSALPVEAAGWATYVGSLHDTHVKKLGDAGSAATYAEPGFLLFDRDDRVVARRIDLGRMELTGDAIPLTDAPPATTEDASRIVTASRNGRVLVSRAQPALVQIEWRDRAGVSHGHVPLAANSYSYVALSPDSRFATVTHSTSRYTAQVMRVDLARGALTPLTDAHNYSFFGVWSPDGRTVANCSSVSGGREEICLEPSDGSGQPRISPSTPLQFKGPVGWSPDQRQLVFYQIDPVTGLDLYALEVGTHAVRKLATDPGAQGFGQVSPDGRWLAYESDESGTSQVFVRSFTDSTGKLQITTDGGNAPRWTKGGREIVYVTNSRQTIRAVPFTSGQPPAPGADHLLFGFPFRMPDGAWDVTADGERFIVLVPAANTPAPTTTLIVDWPAMMNRR
jgi:eukaryotic-like serine/threonine-protein kinase